MVSIGLLCVLCQYENVIHFWFGSLQAGTNLSPSIGVQILALEMHFDVRNEVKMLPFFLKCFPNIEKLHINVKFINHPCFSCNFASLAQLLY
jgi:hypothetical protein